MTDQTGQSVSDCWNRTGVRGDRSCDKLATHTHCRNCDVYASGARSIMQRSLPLGYREEWAEYFARTETEQKELNRSAIVFRIGGEWLALPAAVAITIAETATPHRIPRRSGGALDGIVNVKGTLYPCMSLARLMSIGDGQPVQEARHRVYPRLLVVTLAHQSYALPVDDLHGIYHYADSDVETVPTTVNKSMHRYLTGVLTIDGMRIGCLDAELLGFNLASALK